MNNFRTRILILLGTRPEAVKLAPVVSALHGRPGLEPVVCSTGQHRQMLDAVLEDFGIRPDIELALMTAGQGLNELAGRLFPALAQVVRDTSPACVLVQGDTTTAFAGAVCAFHEGIAVGHVEAGLRSGNMGAPFPEEFNRRAVSLAANWHFAPTEGAARNLLREGVPPDRVFVTGNTVVDALLHMRSVVREAPPALPPAVEKVLAEGGPYVLITGHRRENFGKGLDDICAAIAALAGQRPDCAFIYPVHLNPRVDEVVRGRLSGHHNVLLIEPCSYTCFLRLMDGCLFIISDSGGIQEEAPSLGKRVLVTRETTERPEGLDAGFCRLVGSDTQRIVEAAAELFSNPAPGTAAVNPYGDGRAASRIADILAERHANRF